VEGDGEYDHHNNTFEEKVTEKLEKYDDDNLCLGTS